MFVGYLGSDLVLQSRVLYILVMNSHTGKCYVCQRYSFVLATGPFWKNNVPNKGFHTRNSGVMHNRTVGGSAPPVVGTYLKRYVGL